MPKATEYPPALIFSPQADKVLRGHLTHRNLGKVKNEENKAENEK